MNWEGYIKARYFTQINIFEEFYGFAETIRDQNGTHTMYRPLSDEEALDMIEKWVKKHDEIYEL